MSFFEILMLVSFGAAWPFSIYKSYTSKSSKGKSIHFLYILLFGYICGILHKVFYNFDHVIWLYCLNFIMVFTDTLLYYINKKAEKS